MILHNSQTLESNIRAHDKIAKRYESLHGEIYNDIEQNRLHQDLSIAVSHIQCTSNPKIAIDFGCGAGNLTKHLTLLGLNVIACDISQGFLDLVSSRIYNTKVETVKLNGKDLSNIPDESVDMLATYSVLHHIPDYLSILKEFLRVLKKGGIIYIDHESSSEIWTKNDEHRAFKKEIKKNKLINKNYLVLTNYFDWIIRKFINPRYRREGDIHVFPDDHIEWGKVINTLQEEGGSVVFEKDYLLYRRNYDKIVFEKYKNKINDMHLCVIKKTP